MRAGEAFKLEWIEVDMERHLINRRHPEKGSNPRIFKVSAKLTDMLNQLPRKTEWVKVNETASMHVSKKSMNLTGNTSTAKEWIQHNKYARSCLAYRNFSIGSGDIPRNFPFFLFYEKYEGMHAQW